MRPETDDDWLMVAGDVAETVDDIRWALSTLADRFGKVVWAPGNHELWTHPKDTVTLRGVARYEHLVDVCRELGVITPEDPYPIWNGPGRAGRGGPAVPAVRLQLPAAGLRHQGGGPGRTRTGTGIVCTDEFLLHPDPYPTREAWCRARVAETERRLAALPGDLPTVLVNHYPLDRHPTDVLWLPRVRHVVRHPAHRRLAPQVPRRDHGLRPSAHPPHHLARGRPLRGGLGGLPPRVAAARQTTGAAAPYPAPREVRAR